MMVRMRARLRAMGPGLLAAALLALALLLPPVPLQRPASQALVVFDITQSMDVEDVELDGVAASRFALAREAARRMLARLPCGSRVGWGAFTEYRTLVLLAPIEVCANYADLLATLERIDGSIRWGNASEISKGVFWAMRAARDLGTHPGLVFITDGQEAPPLGSSRFPMFEDLQAGAVPGWLLGVGGSVPRPIPHTDAEGRRLGFWRADEVIQRETEPGAAPSAEHLSQLHETHLRALAAQTGFEYATLRSPEDLVRAVADARLQRPARVLVDLRWLPTMAALLALAWDSRPDRRRPRPAR